MTKEMKSLQIRLPSEILKKIDGIINQGLYRSRSHLMREAVSKFISEFNYSGTLPFIVGPFTPDQLEKLKKAPKESLWIPTSQLKEIKKELEGILG